MKGQAWTNMERWDLVCHIIPDRAQTSPSSLSRTLTGNLDRFHMSHLRSCSGGKLFCIIKCQGPLSINVPVGNSEREKKERPHLFKCAIGTLHSGPPSDSDLHQAAHGLTVWEPQFFVRKWWKMQTRFIQQVWASHAHSVAPHLYGLPVPAGSEITTSTPRLPQRRMSEDTVLLTWLFCLLLLI